MLSVITAVFFDGDQTLWDFEKLMRRAMVATLGELKSLRPGPVTEQLDVDLLVADREAVTDELRGRETNLERLRLAAFRRTVARLRLPDNGLAEHLNAFYLERRFEHVDLYPDVLPALTHLRKTYTLGLLSNGNGYPERSGLAHMFSTVVFSQDHGVEKPDRRLFEIAAVQIDHVAVEIAMVGDSLANDIAGARNAGWRGIWLNREGTAGADRAATDAQITNLSELPLALRHIDTCGDAVERTSCSGETHER